MELESTVLEKLAGYFSDEELDSIVEEAESEIELEKIASEFSEEELAEIIKEAEAEMQEAAVDDELDKLASQFSEEELEEIIKEAEAELTADAEAETEDDFDKQAAAYYELGQHMAKGFQDEIEKEAGKAQKVMDAAKAVRSSAKHYLGKLKGKGDKLLSAGKAKAMEYGKSTKGMKSRYDRNRAGYTSISSKGVHTPVAGKGRLESAKAVYKGMSPERQQSAKRLAGGALAGGVGTAGAGYLAMRKKQEKKASAELPEDVLNALTVLEAHDLL